MQGACEREALLCVSSAVALILGVHTAMSELSNLVKANFNLSVPLVGLETSLAPSALPEVADLRSELAGITEIDDSFFENYAYALPFFSTAGALTVLGRFLVYALEHPYSDTRERMISFLRHISTVADFLTHLTNVQTRCLGQVCHYFANQYSDGSIYFNLCREAETNFTLATKNMR